MGPNHWDSYIYVSISKSELNFKHVKPWIKWISNCKKIGHKCFNCLTHCHHRLRTHLVGKVPQQSDRCLLQANTSIVRYIMEASGELTSYAFLSAT